MDKSSIFFNMPTKLYEIRSGFRPIRMQDFISMLTVPVTPCKNFLGESTGWTKYENKSCGLILTGGSVRVNGHVDEFLDSIQYGKNLENPYNNYVNPFFLFPIMKDEGRAFILRYYDSEINKEIGRQKKSIEAMAVAVEDKKAQLERHMKELKEMEAQNG